MKKGTLLSLLLLIVNYSFCQIGYPKKIVIGKDTVIAITIKQMQIANNTYLQLSECKEIKYHTTKTLDSCTVGLNVYDSTDKNLKAQIVILTGSIQERDRLITTAKTINEKDKTTIKKLKHQNTLLKVSGILISVAIVVISIL